MRKIKKSDLIIETLLAAYIEEKRDFLEDNANLTDFQKGVLYGLKLATVKAKQIVDKKKRSVI